MRILIATVLSAGLLAGAAGPQSFTGVITDTMCGANHKPMNVTPDSKCVLECVKHGSTYALLHRADGWWLGPGMFSHDDRRNCGTGVEVTAWERHGRLVTATVKATHECWACGKSGNDANESDVVLAFDPGATTAYDPVAVGEHTRRDTDDPQSCAPTPPFDAVLAPHWDGTTLTLTGDAKGPTPGIYRFGP